MNIGIVSDTHGNARRLELAIDELTSRGISAIVHCGDLCSWQCLDLLAEARTKAYLVSGNMDRAMGNLSTACRRKDVSWASDFIAVPLGDGRYLAATHGHLSHLLEELVDGGQFALVAHGHTHRRRDEHIGDVRVINPGALHHPRGGTQPGCAWLNAASDRLEFIPID